MKFPDKDVRGAVAIIAAIILLGFLFLIVGCSVAPEWRPELSFGAMREVDRRFGESGWVGYARISQPLHYFGEAPKCIAPPRLSADYIHGSDLLRTDDWMTVDAVGPVLTVPLGRTR